jgi:hypothetical protein
MDCPKCGYAMTSFDVDCPRCKRQAEEAAKKPPPQPVAVAAAPTPPAQPGPPPSSGVTLESIIPVRNGNALAAYYLGLFSGFPGLGLIMGPAAILLGRRGLAFARQYPKVKGTVHARIGIVCGWIGSAINAGLLVLLVLIVGSDLSQG